MNAGRHIIRDSIILFPLQYCSQASCIFLSNRSGEPDSAFCIKHFGRLHEQRIPMLRISPTPFRPSLLSIPPSPQSPLSPIHATVFSAHTCLPRRRSSLVLIPSSDGLSTKFQIRTTIAPPTPLPWIWYCHICKHRYPLGATRRCLEDGHLFCSGDSERVTSRVRRGRHRSVRKQKRGRACSSEFDYTGWKTYGIWRRAEAEEKKRLAHKARGVGVRSGGGGCVGLRRKRDPKNCAEQCDYPSDCRWTRQFMLSQQGQQQQPARNELVIEVAPSSLGQVSFQPTVEADTPFLMAELDPLTSENTLQRHGKDKKKEWDFWRQFRGSTGLEVKRTEDKKTIVEGNPTCVRDAVMFDYDQESLFVIGEDTHGTGIPNVAKASKKA